MISTVSKSRSDKYLSPKVKADIPTSFDFFTNVSNDDEDESNQKQTIDFDYSKIKINLDQSKCSLNLEFDAKSEVLNVFIYDRIGQKKFNSDGFTSEIDIENLPSGEYSICLKFKFNVHTIIKFSKN